MIATLPDLPHQKYVLLLLTVEIYSREASLFGISVEVLPKEIGILTSFEPIQPFLRTFVLFKKTGLSGTVVINSIFLGTVIVFADVVV